MTLFMYFCMRVEIFGQISSYGTLLQYSIAVLVLSYTAISNVNTRYAILVFSSQCFR